jgi:hypothetical protein
MAQLAGADLRKFKARAANLLAVKPAATEMAAASREKPRS